MPSARARGLLIVGHGSRRTAANEVVRMVAGEFAERGGWHAVRAAFLEIASPGIPEAIDALAAARCDEVVVHPFFLFPGQHTIADIPRLVERAAARHASLRVVVTAPLAGHPALLDVVEARIGEAVERLAVAPAVGE